MFIDFFKFFEVGGLIDRNRHKNVCFEQANEQKLKTAHLPLHLLEGGIKGSQVNSHSFNLVPITKPFSRS